MDKLLSAVGSAVELEDGAELAGLLSLSTTSAVVAASRASEVRCEAVGVIRV